MLEQAVFCDLETLSVYEDSVILSMGLLCVDFNQQYTYQELLDKGTYVKFDFIEQKQLGRHILTETVNWWKEQGITASHVLNQSKEDVSVMNIKLIIDQFVKDNDIDYKAWWFQRGDFDYNIIRDIYRKQLKIPEDFLPWKPWNKVCTRSFIRGAGGDIRGKVDLPDDSFPGFVKHHALHDVCADVLQLQYLFNQT